MFVLKIKYNVSDQTFFYGKMMSTIGSDLEKCQAHLKPNQL